MDDKASILIVDDRPEKVLSLQAVLEDLGQVIVTAGSGRDALRHVLATDFAVILLDVNMPGMDGFETASLIRQRPNSMHVPIIFVTSFSEEIHASRGYSLGAVDYIQAPVVPDVLRTKVAVFVDLYRKTHQLKRQAESLQHRAVQLQKLAAASVTINSAISLEQMLRVIADAARDIIGSHQAIMLHLDPPLPGKHAGRTLAVGSFSDQYAAWQDRTLELDRIAGTVVAQSRIPTRLTDQQLRAHADWQIVQSVDLPPVRGGMIAAPLCGRDGENLGVIYLTDRHEGAFTADDEMILVQLAQMASIAIENTRYNQEREANRLKDEFLATLSHELRTPLNAILGWTGLMKYEALSGEVGHAMEVIDRNARAQAKLIEDLLEVSRITSGKLRIVLREMDLAAVIDATVEAVRPMAAEKNIELQCELDTLPRIAGDPDRLQQVVWNLLSNALKFTSDNGVVVISGALGDDGREIRISVSDNGQGIDPQFLPYVFERFRQADSSSTRRHAGLGIGLTIVRHIVELHGGSVQVHSEGEGRGATFSVLLPYEEPAVRAGLPDGSPASLDRDRPAPRAPGLIEAADEPELEAALTGVRILVVEDDADAREVVAEVLRRQQAEVLTASSAAEAMMQLLRQVPDVLVSDISMPNEDGLSLIRRIRRLPAAQGGQVPAIALTAHARDSDRQKMLAAGYQEHVSKPVRPADLVRMVHKQARAAPLAAVD